MTKPKPDAGSARRTSAIRSSVFAAVAVLSLGGCAALSEPKIPGVDNKVLIMKPPAVSTVLTALKCQLARAFVEIDDLKTTAYANNPVAQKFKFNKGTGVFKGKTQIIHGNTGTVSAIIPFTGFAGSTLTPDLGAALKGTDTGTTTRSFSITTSAKDSKKICDGIDKLGLKPGDFLEKKVVAGFRTSVDLPLELVEEDEQNVKETEKVKCKVGDNGKLSVDTEAYKDNKGDNDKKDEKICKYLPRYDPVFTETELKIETIFVVDVGFDGGVGSTVLLSNPRLTSIGPGATADYDKTETYTLTVTLPIGTKKETEDDPRRITYCDVSDTNKVGTERIKLLCVEEQYEEDRYTALLSGLNGDLPYGISQIAIRTALEILLKEAAEAKSDDAKLLGEALTFRPGESPGELEKVLENALKKAVKKVVAETTGKQWESLKEMLRKLWMKENLKGAKWIMSPDGTGPPEIEIPDYLYLGPAPLPPGH